MQVRSLSKLTKLVTLCLIGSMLLACNSAPDLHQDIVTRQTYVPPVWLDAAPFGPEPEIIEVQDLFKLSAEQLEDFKQFSQRPEQLNEPPNEVIANYLKGHLVNFNYYSDTLRAKDSLIQQQGNCLSLAIITKALANLNKVDIQYQLVETDPIYQKEGNVIVSSQHVRTKLLLPRQANDANSYIIFRGGTIVDYFPQRGSHLLRSVSENEFFGMYYRNKGAEAILKKDYNKAYWLARKTLSLYPTDPHGLNLIALTYYHKGLFEKAEAIYQEGIAKNDDKLDLLSNYYYLLKKLGKNETAKTIHAQIIQYDNQNPFRWISLANNAFNEKNYPLAKSYYRKARDLAPYLHEAYAGIAQSDIQMGNMKSAEKALEKALEKAHRRTKKELYQKKLELLSDLLTRNYKE
ncbi:tetratricopeptide repeat protein [Aliikangiella sp. G2MR2-5]|uniref:tetratricopeptide repeat protein n=1 Tax=Aliikangiella sp. G2MR2-5 TaxID=2788943 RepID=UPI0018AA5E0D|nr:hypothetical protein [Aliikangiella sp. G2MR2-5]